MKHIPEIGIVIPAYNESSSITSTLDALYHQDYQENVSVTVVDNNSSDDTFSLVENYRNTHLDFPLSIIHESRKGTGAAADTGARHLIEMGKNVIARTDADTIPAKRWTRAIAESMTTSSHLQLITGPVGVRKDDAWYRPGDNAIVTIGANMTRVMRVIQRGDLASLKTAAGLNFATRSDAYQELDGFPRTAISELDEDLDYSYRLHEMYGYRSMGYNSEMKVDTSARRMRTLGYTGTLRYYMMPPNQRQSSFGDEIDFR